MIGRAGLTESDREDLVQEFVLDHLRRRHLYDSHAAPWEAFVLVLCQNCAARILEHRQALKRTWRREAGSLNRPVVTRDGGSTEYGETLSQSQLALRTGQHRRSEEEAWNLAHDLRQVFDQMPPTMRKVCPLLMRHTKAQTADKLGISQGALYEILSRVLVRFEKAGLRDYLR